MTQKLSEHAQNNIDRGVEAHRQKLVTCFTISEFCHTSIPDLMSMNAADLGIIMGFIRARAERANDIVRHEGRTS